MSRAPTVMETCIVVQSAPRSRYVHPPVSRRGRSSSPVPGEEDPLVYSVAYGKRILVPWADNCGEGDRMRVFELEHLRTKDFSYRHRLSIPYPKTTYYSRSPAGREFPSNGVAQKCSGIT